MEREIQRDPENLCELWLETAEQLLKRPRFTGSEIETHRIALRKYAREKNRDAKAMLKRLDEAYECAHKY